MDVFLFTFLVLSYVSGLMVFSEKWLQNAKCCEKV